MSDICVLLRGGSFVAMPFDRKRF